MSFEEIIHSLNVSHSFLLAQKNRNMTKAIVDLDGNGHYLTLSAAISAGEKYIYLKDGTHSVSSNITLSDQKIIGESRRNTVLKFTNNAKLIFDSSGDIVNEGGAGTYEIQLTQDDDLVSQAGSQDCGFTAVASVTTDTRIKFKSFLNRVETITDTNNLDIFNIVPGRVDDLAGSQLAIQPYNMGNYSSNGTEISNLTFYFFSTPSASDINCIECYGFNHKFENISFLSINDDVIFIHFVPSFTDKKLCSNILIDNCSFEGGINAIKGTRISNSIFSKNQFTNQKAEIIDFENGTNIYTLIFIQNSFTHGFKGIYLPDNSYGISIKYNNFFNIEETAIIAEGFPNQDGKLDIIGNKFFQCGEDNVNKGEKEVIVSSMNGTLISANNFEKCEHPIYLEVGGSIEADYDVVVSSNVFKECAECIHSEVYGGIIKNNVFIECETEILAGSNYNIFQGNQIIDFQSSNPFAGHNMKIIGNQFFGTSDITYNFTSNDVMIIGNWFEKGKLDISGNRYIIKGNQFRNIDSGFAISLSGDQNLLSINFLKDCAKGVEIEATADKTNALENIWHTVTASTLVDNGTNTVTSNNITV